MSTGTEGIILHQLFSPDTNWADYGRLPFHPGYSVTGVVERIGSKVRELAVGQPVALRRGHASRHVVAAEDCVPIPAEVRLEDAAWFALAWIGFRGLQAARLKLGDDVLIVGAGPIGQMFLRWAVVAGAWSTVVVDPLRARLAFAERGGATTVIDRPIDQAGELLAADGGVPATIVDTTGNASVFESLLGIAPRYGRIVLLGDTGHPEEQRLTQDVVLKGLTIRGAHDGHDRGGWSGRRVTEWFFHLLRSGRFSIEGLATHRFSPREAREAYAIASTRREETMGVLFDWSTV